MSFIPTLVQCAKYVTKRKNVKLYKIESLVYDEDTDEMISLYQFVERSFFKSKQHFDEFIKTIDFSKLISYYGTIVDYEASDTSQFSLCRINIRYTLDTSNSSVWNPRKYISAQQIKAKTSRMCSYEMYDADYYYYTNFKNAKHCLTLQLRYLYNLNRFEMRWFNTQDSNELITFFNDQNFEQRLKKAHDKKQYKLITNLLYLIDLAKNHKHLLKAYYETCASKIVSLKSLNFRLRYTVDNLDNQIYDIRLYVPTVDGNEVEISKFDKFKIEYK